MEQSESIDELAGALLRVQEKLPVIPKTHTAKIPTKNGGGYEYKYADLEDCVTASRPVLVENGISVIQPPDGNGLTTQVMHKSGQWMRATMDLHPSSTHQEQGSSITYARRYAWCSTLGLLADEDVDGPSGSQNSPATAGQQATGASGGQGGGAGRSGNAAPANRQSQSGQTQPPSDRPGNTEGGGIATMATKPQLGRIATICKKLGISEAFAVEQSLGKKIPVEILTKSQAHKVNEWLTVEQNNASRA